MTVEIQTKIHWRKFLYVNGGGGGGGGIPRNIQPPPPSKERDYAPVEKSFSSGVLNE